MLSRFISRHSQLRLLTLISASPHHPSIPKSHSLHTLHPPLRTPNFNTFFETSRSFSTNRNNGGDNTGNDQPTGFWKLSPENDDSIASVFGDDAGNLEGFADGETAMPNDESWLEDSRGGGGIGKESGGKKRVDDWPKTEGFKQWSFGDKGKEEDVFDFGAEEGVAEVSSGGGEIGKESGGEKRVDAWPTAEGFKQWSFGEKEEEDVFDLGAKEGVAEVSGGGDGGDEWFESQRREEERLESLKREENKALQREEKELSLVLQGPNRAFGDLIAASGITEAMLDSLMALKDMEGIQGLPPLREIEDLRYEKNTRKSTKGDIERQKQEEIAKARVVKIDEKGRAYGTGKRKCSIARVWIQPGEGEFLVNDKQFDAYFPMLDHRAALLRPFSETKTLGLWDIKCTVKGGGVSGQVDAIRLGISRALQNWEPGLRPPLRAAGFLTRDSRIVERKKPGKAKARKSFQWVKR